MTNVSAEGYEKYFSMIDPDFLREMECITENPELQKDFKVAYMILFFHLSKEERTHKNILLGDLFISILTKRLIKRNQKLLSRIIRRISFCHSENILWKVKCFKRELLNLLEEVEAYDGSI